MMIMLASAAFVLAAVCAALMGYAIQRGATCTVAAIGELVENRSAKRLTALAEASLWVAGGLAVARLLGLIPSFPAGFALTGTTVIGGMLLGLGAYVNGACVFGAIARLGSGDWAYCLTPVGFFAAVASVATVFGNPMPPSVEHGLASPVWIALPFIPFALWRIARVWRKARNERSLAQHIWAPHEATILIGITFTIMFVGVGAWTYTDLLIRLAAGMATNYAWQLLLFAALLTGAIAGGWTAGKLGLRRPTAMSLVRCFTGGMLMGWGSLMIPGGNDGLILVGMPFLWPYAWVAIAMMCATIAIALFAQRMFRQG